MCKCVNKYLETSLNNFTKMCISKIMCIFIILNSLIKNSSC